MTKDVYDNHRCSYDYEGPSQVLEGHGTGTCHRCGKRITRPMSYWRSKERGKPAVDLTLRFREDEDS